MKRTRLALLLWLAGIGVGQSAWLLSAAAADDAYTVFITTVDDLKAVFGTVETRNVVNARTRIGGTVSELQVDEGTEVEEGQQVALIVDPKIAVQLAAAEARIQAAQSQKRLAESTLNRNRKLFAEGNVSRARLDQAETDFEVADRELTAATADRKVILERQGEGAVLAPAQGRVTRVPVTDGTVVLPGDPIATIAVQGAILRIQLPERHARFIRVGDQVLVGERGMEAAPVAGAMQVRSGHVVKVFPELVQGRVIADVEAEDLGNFFVGERVRAYVPTGQRNTVVVPDGFLFDRFGVTFARLESGREVVVQPGLPSGDGIEVLAGLREGDVIVRPERTP
ncbi:MAG: efflux RND transporter periplasmic adaptor subunit [Rhodospirillales bacterium]|nr:efflux RND transporter periplasmic adaptor subunit [Rhodospirillales bacterium]